MNFSQGPEKIHSVSLASLADEQDYGEASGQWSREYYGDDGWCRCLGLGRPGTLGTANRNVREEAKRNVVLCFKEVV